MFYESLISINKKFGLPLEVLKKLDYELTILKPDDTVSASFISRKTNIAAELVESILIELAHNSIFNVKYIVLCLNYDKEMIHGFEFDNKKDLKRFILSSGSICPECTSKMDIDDIRVAFIKKDPVIN